MTDKITLKKYANRRLYDTEKSQYVTLNQVADRIRDGQQVEVLDAKTKEDVTAFILTQILLEEAKSKNVLLPAPLPSPHYPIRRQHLAGFFRKTPAAGDSELSFLQKIL